MKYVFYATLAIGPDGDPGNGRQGAADNEMSVSAAKAIGGGIGFGLAAGLAGIGQGFVGSRAAEGAARNPGAAGTVQTLMIIALALIESLVLFALAYRFRKTLSSGGRYKEADEVSISLVRILIAVTGMLQICTERQFCCNPRRSFAYVLSTDGRTINRNRNCGKISRGLAAAQRRPRRFLSRPAYFYGQAGDSEGPAAGTRCG